MIGALSATFADSAPACPAKMRPTSPVKRSLRLTTINDL